MSNLGEEAAPYEPELLDVLRKMLVWRSTRLFAYFLLLVAIIIGAHLRFHRLAPVSYTHLAAEPRLRSRVDAAAQPPTA